MSDEPKIPVSRESLGRDVCDVALKWSRENDDRPGVTATWENLDEETRELYMRTGESLFALGMTFSPVPQPVGETRTEWGFEITSDGVTSVCRSTTEAAARGELKFFEKLNPRVMKRTVVTGPWTEAA